MHPTVARLHDCHDVPVVTEHQRLFAARFRAAAESCSDDSFGAGAIVRDDGRVVLVKNAWSDGWIFPGGTDGPGESDEGIREVAWHETVPDTVQHRDFLVSQQSDEQVTW